MSDIVVATAAAGRQIIKLIMKLSIILLASDYVNLILRDL